MSSEQTICHIIDRDKILLKLATRGISKGRWNAPGGHIDPGETPEQCAIREVFEETGLVVKEPTLHGIILFYNNKSDTPTVKVYIFSAKTFSGELKSSDEGEVRWFSRKELPWQQMWSDDKYWLDGLLDGKKFSDASFHFNEDNTKVVKHTVHWE